jgi:hypothetical protein
MNVGELRTRINRGREKLLFLSLPYLALGCLIALFIIHPGLFTGLPGVLSHLWTVAHHTMGMATVPLLATAAILLALTGHHAQRFLAGKQLGPKEVGVLAKIEWIALLLGLLGTVGGLSTAMKGLQISMGLDEMLSTLTRTLGESLGCTMVGLFVSIVAGLQVPESAPVEEDE